MNLCAIILARSGSKRFKNKNIAKFSGCVTNLLETKILQIKKTKLFSKIILSSDSEKYLEYAEALNIISHKRKNLLSSDSASSIDAINSVISDLDLKFSSIYLFPVTSPFFGKECISEFIKESILFDDETTITSGFLSKDSIWKISGQQLFLNESRNQQDREGFIVETSAAYKFKVSAKSKKIDVDFSKFKFILFDRIKSFDINDQMDFDIADSMYVKNKSIIDL